MSCDMSVIFTFGELAFLFYVYDRRVIIILSSKIEHTTKVVNWFYPLTIFAKRFSLDV